MLSKYFDLQETIKFIGNIISNVKKDFSCAIHRKKIIIIKNINLVAVPK